MALPRFRAPPPRQLHGFATGFASRQHASRKALQSERGGNQGTPRATAEDVVAVAAAAAAGYPYPYPCPYPNPVTAVKARGIIRASPRASPSELRPVGTFDAKALRVTTP